MRLKLVVARGRRHTTPLLAAAALVVAIACGDPYLHTNPYDPAVPVAIDVTGPDTLFSLGAVGQYSVQTAPAFPDSAIVWSIDTALRFREGADGDSTVDGSLYVVPAGDGALQLVKPPLEPSFVTIAMHAGIGTIDTTVQVYSLACLCTVLKLIHLPRHIGTKTTIVMQRVTRIQLRCPDTHACDPVTVGGTWSVWVDGFDALNRQIASLTSSTANPSTGPLVVTYLVRDTTIARSSPVGIRAATITAISSGTTWVVATRGALADSLRLVVP